MRGHLTRRCNIQVLTALRPQGTGATVFLRAPRELSYGSVAKVIDGIKGAGANPVGLQIDELR